MRMRVDEQSAERMAALEEGCQVTAGSLDPATFARSVEDARIKESSRDAYLSVFSRLVSMARRNANLTIEQLAEKTDIDAVELFDMEENLKAAPEPRVVSKVARALNLPAGKLMQLAGHVSIVDPNVAGAAFKFAASSGSVKQLTSEEKSALNAFVAALCQD